MVSGIASSLVIATALESQRNPNFNLYLEGYFLLFTLY